MGWWTHVSEEGNGQSARSDSEDSDLNALSSETTEDINETRDRDRDKR